MNGSNQLPHHNSSPTPQGERLSRFEQLAVLAAYEELSVEEQREFETLLASDELHWPQYRAYQELRELSRPENAQKIGLTLTEPRPQTIAAVTQAAKQAMAGRRVKDRETVHTPSPVLNWLRVFFDGSFRWPQWAAAAACASLLFMIFQFGTGGYLGSDSNVTSVSTLEPYELASPEVVDLEIAAAVDDLDRLELEVGLWLEEMDVS